MIGCACRFGITRQLTLPVRPCTAMILEGIVTTVSALGAVNIAPMGPPVENETANHDWTRFALRPFRASQTFANLNEHNEGVLHVTDDVLLLARSAVGALDPLPALRPAARLHPAIRALPDLFPPVSTPGAATRGQEGQPVARCPAAIGRGIAESGTMLDVTAEETNQ